MERTLAILKPDAVSKGKVRGAPRGQCSACARAEGRWAPDSEASARVQAEAMKELIEADGFKIIKEKKLCLTVNQVLPLPPARAPSSPPRPTEATARPSTQRASRLSFGAGAQAKTFYKEHAQRPFYGSLVNFMTSGDCVVLLLQKDNAIKDWRSLMGPTNSIKVPRPAPPFRPCAAAALPLDEPRRRPKGALTMREPARRQARAEAKDSLRAKFGTDGSQNACHGASAPRNAASRGSGGDPAARH